MSLAERDIGAPPHAQRVAAYDWTGIAATLDERGAAVLPA